MELFTRINNLNSIKPQDLNPSYKKRGEAWFNAALCRNFNLKQGKQASFQKELNLPPLTIYPITLYNGFILLSHITWDLRTK